LTRLGNLKEEITLKTKKDDAALRPGQGGACEGILFQFVEATRGAPEPVSKSIAAITIDDAFRYVRRRYPEFRIAEIRAGALIEMVSGSPVD
jgi:hypothetical protein